MCGIAGILSVDKRGSIRGMTDALGHRGPDGVGYFEDDKIALGHTRLSIIDLEGGAQPISNEDNSLQLICNGEIYNSPQLRQKLIGKGHRFKTNSDVEVILHLYEEHGKRCVNYLRGMFAFALWDSRAKSLFLGRDQLGQKPLFYYRDGATFVFASEIKGLFASGLVSPKICLEGLWHYMSLRFMPDQYSLFEGAKKLPAASTLIVKDGKIEIEKYWSLSFEQKLTGSENELVDRLDDVLGR